MAQDLSDRGMAGWRCIQRTAVSGRRVVHLQGAWPAARDWRRDGAQGGGGSRSFRPLIKAVPRSSAAPASAEELTSARATRPPEALPCSSSRGTHRE